MSASLAGLALAAEPAGWSEFLTGIAPDHRFVLLLAIVVASAVALISVCGLVVGAFNAAHRRRLEAELKRDMLDRGMTADEVVKVIEAASPPKTPPLAGSIAGATRNDERPAPLAVPGDCLNVAAGSAVGRRHARPSKAV